MSLLADYTFDWSFMVAEGSFANVYKGTLAKDHRKKVVARIPKATGNALSFFIHEVSLLYLIGEHPNIVETLLVAAPLQDTVVLVNPCAFTTLDRWSDVYQAINCDKPRIPETMARWVFKSIRAALLHAHQAKVAHRDVKCANVFLFWVPGGNGFVDVKLGDWNLGIYMQENTLTANRNVGSPWYHAPECVAAKVKTVNPYLVDVWCLGMVLYKMVYGRNPFNLSNINTPTDCYMDRVVAPAWEILFPRLVSKSCINILRAMLSRNPAQRPTMEQLGDFEWAAKCNMEPLSVLF